LGVRNEWSAAFMPLHRLLAIEHGSDLKGAPSLLAHLVVVLAGWFLQNKEDIRKPPLGISRLRDFKGGLELFGDSELFHL
jgi:hypothetical protein